MNRFLCILFITMSHMVCASLPTLTVEQTGDAIDAKGTVQGPVIPGLRQGAIPQGVTYLNDPSLILMTHYFPQDFPSCISLQNHENSEFLGIKWIRKPDGTSVTGHVGGICAGRDNLWVSSGGFVYQYRINDVLNKKGTNPITAIGEHRVETRASYCTHYNGLLFVGEFANYSFPYTSHTRYPTNPSHHIMDRHGRKKYAWICAYDPGKGLQTPVRILSVRQKVQGIAITDENIFLSISYGRKNNSKLAIYRNPFAEDPHRNVTSSSGEQVPLWFLDESTWLRTITLPPMAQEIAFTRGKLAVLYESGAEKYRKDTPAPVERILYYDVMEWLK